MIDDPSRSGPPVPRLRALARVGMLGVRTVRRLTPALFDRLAARRPQLRMAWGDSEIHLRRDGLVRIAREQQAVEIEATPVEIRPAGEPFVPRREGEAADGEYMFRTPPEGIEIDDTPLEMTDEALAAEVQRRMGERPELEEEGLALPEDMKDADTLNAEFVRIRDMLQSLDDVEDHDLIKALDDELYQLYKAVDYKIRRHHASEAKAELGKLFKM
jgi:hypothetical protein